MWGGTAHFQPLKSRLEKVGVICFACFAIRGPTSLADATVWEQSLQPEKFGMCQTITRFDNVWLERGWRPGVQHHTRFANLTYASTYAN